MEIEYIEVYRLNKQQDRVSIIGLIDEFNSVIWHTCYNSTGDFEIYCAINDNNLNYRIGDFVRCPLNNDVGIIERIEKTFTDKEGYMLLLSGRMADSILDRRIIYRRIGNKPYPVILTGNVQKEIDYLIKICFGNGYVGNTGIRNIPLFNYRIEKASPQVIVDEEGKSSEKQVTFDNLLEYVQALLLEYGLGIRAYLPDGIGEKQIYLSQYVGEEKDLVFSTEFDNLNSAELIKDDTTYKNVALIAGEGEGTERQTTVLNNDRYSGLDRYETFVDGSGISKTYEGDSGEEQTYTEAEYQSLLQQEGKQKLAGMEKTVTFSGDAELLVSGLEFRKDFYLGDIVTIEDSTIGFSGKVRILEATEVQDEKGYTINFVYGG